MAHGEVVARVSHHWDRPMWRYATLRVLSKMYRKLLFNNLTILWNIKIHVLSFCRECPQMLCAKFGANQWNRLRGVWKSRFSEMGVPYITRFSTIQWTCGYKVFECPTKYMCVISQNALSLIIAPPSDGNQGQQYIMKFFGRCEVFSKKNVIICNKKSSLQKQ